ncbi:hypothetical protein BC828DRAFT_331977, partial [Blastocladiella britannica]
DPEDQRPFCYCHQPSYGSMIGCDNPSCTTEWFHFSCAGFKEGDSPPDTWFCDPC